MERLDGTTILITGGARGMGAQMGELFASHGATVVLTDVLDDQGEQTAAAIDNASYRHLDVRSEDEWEQLVGDVMAVNGRIDVLATTPASTS